MNEKLTYKAAGVDVEAGYRAVKLMKEHKAYHDTRSARRTGQLRRFSELDKEKYRILFWFLELTV